MSMSQGTELLESFTQFLKVIEYQYTYLSQLDKDFNNMAVGDIYDTIENLENNQAYILNRFKEYIAVYDTIQSRIDAHKTELDTVLTPRPIPEVLNRLFEQ